MSALSLHHIQPANMSSQYGSEDCVGLDDEPAEPPPYTIRGILLETKWTRCRYPCLCYPSHMGSLAGQVRAPYLPIACELSPDGHRFLSDETLDEVAPDWRNYMIGWKLLPATYSHLQSAWDAWCKNERRRYFELGVPYPTPRDSDEWISLGAERPPTVNSGWLEDEEQHQYEPLRVNAEVTVSVSGSLLDSGRAPVIGAIRGMERCRTDGLSRERILVNHPASWLPEGTSIELYSDGLFDIPGTQWGKGGFEIGEEKDWEFLSHDEH